MTLEKLLIFGFGLAVVTALAITGSNMADDRSPDYDGYKSKVTTMLDKMR